MRRVFSIAIFGFEQRMRWRSGSTQGFSDTPMSSPSIAMRKAALAGAIPNNGHQPSKKKPPEGGSQLPMLLRWITRPSMQA